MILVTGAAGKTGRAIIQVLAGRPEPIRALAHRPDQAPALRELGVHEVLVGDLLDHAAVEKAVEGARAIYHMAPNVSPDEVSIGKIVIAAAQSANAERFVFHSVLHPHIEAMPHHWQKAGVEELLFASGLSFTILQPAVYMQNVLAHWEQIVEGGRYMVPYSPETRLSLVDLDDVAQAAALALTDAGLFGATIELVGTPPLSQIQVAETLGQELNRSVTAEAVKLEEWERNARASGMGDYQVHALTKMFRYYEAYGFEGNSSALRCLLRRGPVSFADFVRRVTRDKGK